jgi:hypothetical protein
LLCQLVFQPVIKLIQIAISVIEFILVQICQLVQEIVSVIIQVLQYICNTVVQTICGAVCGVVCGICDFFCGIFGCDCGCQNVCNNVCNAVTNVVCAWTYVLQTVLQAITVLVCNYILQAIITILNLIEAIVTMVLTWVCTLIDLGIRWFLCWTYIAEIFDNTEPRRFRVAPKIVRNNDGYSDWFVYVNNADDSGNVPQKVQGYILSDQGHPLVPIVDSQSGTITYYEVETNGDFITGTLKRRGGREGDYIPGQPFLYYPYKVMEIASHLLGDIFAANPGDDGTGTDFHKNLFTYNSNVQAWLAGASDLADNQYNAWTGKYDDKTSSNYFGDGTISDMGMRVDTDATCSHPTNAFLHLVNSIEFTPPTTAIAETMSCGAGQTLTLDETNFLLLNETDGSSVTTYFVTKYNQDESSVGCNDLLGYTIVTFDGGGQSIFVSMKVLAFKADTNQMMAEIVQNISAKTVTAAEIVRVAETYLHECGHQCGLLHDTDKPNCENDTTLHISKLMNPSGVVRRAYTRLQWCLVRTSNYMTSRSLTAFTQAPELPDSGTVPGGM